MLQLSICEYRFHNIKYWTIMVNYKDETLHGISLLFVNLQVKVKLCLGPLGGDLVAELPFVLMHPKPEEEDPPSPAQMVDDANSTSTGKISNNKSRDGTEVSWLSFLLSLIYCSLSLKSYVDKQSCKYSYCQTIIYIYIYTIRGTLHNYRIVYK